MSSIEQAHGLLLKEERLQFDFPDRTPAPAPPDAWFSHLTWDGSPLGWAIVAVAVVLASVVIWHVWRTRPAERPAAPAPEEAPVIRPEVARASLMAADRLAAQGRFAQAAHVLLACGVDEIDRRFPGLLRPATTSRDIGALDRLPRSLRGPFARIAAVVEAGVFGGRSVSADHYAECRGAFVTSALAGRSWAETT